MINNEKLKRLVPSMSRRFFILFSHSIVLVSFVLYLPISTGEYWARIYGLGVSIFFGMGNGIAHFAIYMRTKHNTGVLSGLFQLISSCLLWATLFLQITF
ncbi:MAG: hypothetical protein ACW964_07415 [Candidatus Hodarchaeales archaeon]